MSLPAPRSSLLARGLAEPVYRALILLAALVLVSLPFTVPPLVDAATGDAADYATLAQPFPFLLFAPLFGVWDSLSLLTGSQHYAVVVTLVGLYVAWRIRAPRADLSLLRRFGREALHGGGAFLLLLGFYAVGLLVPRPMVGIALADPDLMSIDFHSHTLHSHDGWGLFSAARNRAWHEGGGFDVAYVTDHYTWEGVDDARTDNPRLVGERTALLSGAEIRIHRRPTNILGHRDRYLFALDADSLYMEPDSLRARPRIDGLPPTLLYTMPGGLQFVVPYSDADPSGVIGIEINDGSPRGLEQTRRERSEILALADSADLALIGASNLHGWGRTVASWSVMRMPGWQAMAPEEVGAAIEAKLHAERRRSGTVVERRMPYHEGSTVRIVLTAPWLLWEHFRMLSAAERVSWLAWLAALAAARFLWTARQREADALR